MARKEKPGRLVSILRQLFGDSKPSVIKTTLNTDKDSSISTKERERIVNDIIEATRSPTERRGFDPYERYIQPLARRITAARLDAESIEALAPEVKKAKQIVIPSIMSPTDMRDGEISIQSTSTLVTDAQNEEISKILNDHFNKDQKLSTRLPIWIHESLYGAGSQPILVLPVTEIDTIINDPDAVLLKTTRSTESMSLDIKAGLIDAKSIFGISDSVHIGQKPIQDDLRPALESLITTYIKTTPDLRVDLSYDFSKNWNSTTSKKISDFAKQAIEALNVVDNPDTIKIDRVRKSAKMKELKSRVATIYKSQSLITINSETKKSIGDPVIYELPPESVIPIFTPGTPSDHIGYFILLDEFGQPIHLSADGPVMDMTDNRQVTPVSLYKSFGFGDSSQSLKGGQLRKEQTELMTGVYQTIVETHLKNRLKNSGFSNIYIGASSSVYRCMFSRYLSLRKTKLLFVPRDLMTYICFRYNKDGTGRSKIEDIKFILSLKITVLVCRVMAAMNSSINRRKLTVNFTENMGDPVAFFQQLEKEAIDKSVMNFTYDPTEITRTLAQRSLTIAAKGIPGAENYDISQEPNELKDVRPDDSLLEDLNNMLVLDLDVPPSAYNLLSDNEFSRSVATNNLFFSRIISGYQKTVCTNIARHAQIYTHMSETLKTKIRRILTIEKSSIQDIKNDGTSEETDDKSSGVAVQLADIINNIIAILPSPDIAPSKTEFEEVDAIITAINTMLEGVFDNDLGSTDDNPIAMIRAMVKESVIRDYITKIGVMRDVSIPDFENPEFIRKLHIRKLQLINLQKGLKAASAVTQPSETPETSPNDTQTF